MTTRETQAARIAQVTGVALAGGRSRRMGSDKAGMRLDGQPLIARAVARLALVFEEVIVIGPRELAAHEPGAPIFVDDWPGRGPLGGLATALRHMRTDWLFLVACDMPFLQPALMRYITERALSSTDAGAVATRGPGGWEPLHAAYHRRVAPVVAQALMEERPALRALLDEVNALEIAAADVARLDPLGHSTFNANTLEEWEQARRMVESEENSDV
jgi:molybdopterin-guanine dinucleotide biosynthesis protein A